MAQALTQLHALVRVCVCNSSSPIQIICAKNFMRRIVKFFDWWWWRHVHFTQRVN